MSAPKDHHKSKMVKIDQKIFEEFAVKSTQEDYKPDTAYGVIDKECMARIDKENACFQPIAANVFSESIDETELQGVFGDAYIEGLSNPRIFMVTLSLEKLTQISGFVLFKVVHSDSQKMNCLGDELNDGTCVSNVVKVNLILRCNISNEQSEIVHQKLSSQLSLDSSPHSVLKLVTFVEKAVNSSSQETCTKELPVKSKPPSSPRFFSHLANINGWNVGCFDEKEALKVLEDEALALCKRVITSSLVKSTPRDTNELACEICATPWDDHSTGCAMQSCDHFYCSNCWQNHLVSRVMLRDHQLSCPGSGCNTSVDTVTFMSLLPYSYYVKYQSYINSARLESSSNWKWCQGLGGKCQKIIRATTSESTPCAELGELICVSCTCKAGWCFSCGNEAHWPATCEQATVYFELIRKKGDKETLKTLPPIPEAPPVYFANNVKKCPRCKYPIEKYGSAPCMRCPFCRLNGNGFTFCWNCLEQLPHNNENNLCKKTAPTVTFELGDVTPKFKSEQCEQAFTNAVEWRKHRHSHFKQYADTPILHDLTFLLEWSYVVVYVSCLNKVSCKWLQARLKTLQFLVSSCKQRPLAKNKGMKQMKEVEEKSEEPVRQICAGINCLQIAVSQAQKEEQTLKEKRIKQKKRRNITTLDLLKE